jgi:hypothetical protein
MPTYNVRCLLDTQRSGEGMAKGEAGELREAGPGPVVLWVGGGMIL